MGKSKSGGTRGYIRGRIANDVYSIGKDGKGKKQQVIRSLAESVANPRTTAQMRGRMIMSTVMQAVAGFSTIIDHAFDGIPTGQPNISEFIRLNYALVSADAKAHPASGNAFGLVKYGEKGVRMGAYQLSDGAVPVPASVIAVDSNATKVEISDFDEDLTIGHYKSLLGFSDEDYITVVAVTALNTVEFVRLRFNPALPDSTVVSASNIDNVFVTEGNAQATIAFADGVISVNTLNMGGCAGFILSVKEDGAWKHSKCTMKTSGTLTYVSDTALPTYPTGTEQFLNGGDI